MAQDQRQYWAWARELLDTRSQRKWSSFSWITTRALISSLNDQVSRLTPTMVGELRAQWMARPEITAGLLKNNLVIDRTDVTSFIVLGDPGEQDASQYVVVPALEDAVRTNPDIGLMVVCSDVIYPSGDVNDYVDGFYVPFQNLRDLPIYGLPGNHDWYDGLAGFMWNFCDQDPLPKSSYGVTGTPKLEWLGRLFWRRPSHRTTTEGLEARRRIHRVAATQTIDRRRGVPSSIDLASAEPIPPLQVAPYFAIATKHLLLVCIDTGIDGTIDRRQGEWLVAVSNLPGRKLLLTGKPLLVDQEVEACAIGGGPVADGAASFASVLEVVQHAPYGYVASLGGDIHNYQLYATGTQPHIVSGGGGAFMSATHTITEAANSPTNTSVRTDAPPLQLSPTEPESLSHFTQLMLPKLWRLERFLLALVVGTAVGGVLPGVVDDVSTTALVAAIVLAVVVTIRFVFLPTDWVTSPWYRAGVTGAGGLIGVVLASTTAWLDPDHYPTDLVVAAAGFAITVVFFQAVRWTGWWSPAPPAQSMVTRSAQLAGTTNERWAPPRPQSGDNFVGRTGVVAMVLAVATLVGAIAQLETLTICAAVTLTIWLAGWFGGRQFGWWRTWGTTVAFVATSLVIIVIACEATAMTAFDVTYVTVTAVLLPIVTAVAALIVTCLLAALAAVILGGGPASPLASATAAGALPASTAKPAFATSRFGTGWGRVGSVAPWLFAGLLVVGGIVANAIWPPTAGHIWPFGDITRNVEPEAVRHAAVAVAVLLTLAVMLIFVVDALRRHTGRSFKPWAALIVVVAAGFIAPDSFWSGTFFHDAIGAAVIGSYLLLLLLVGNLVLIGAPSLIIDTAAHTDEKPLLPLDAATTVLAWRNKQAGVARPERTSRRRANIVSPGSDKPQGPFQKLVAEVFDSDDPPFFKNFVVVRTSEATVDVDLVIVTGTENNPPRLPPDQSFAGVTVRHRY